MTFVPRWGHFENMPTNLVGQSSTPMPTFSSIPQSMMKHVAIHTYIHTYIHKFCICVTHDTASPIHNHRACKALSHNLVACTAIALSINIWAFHHRLHGLIHHSMSHWVMSFYSSLTSSKLTILRLNQLYTCLAILDIRGSFGKFWNMCLSCCILIRGKLVLFILSVNLSLSHPSCLQTSSRLIALQH